MEDRKAHTASVYDIKIIQEKTVWSISKDKLIFVWSPKVLIARCNLCTNTAKKSQPLKKILAGFLTTLLEVEEHVWCGTIDGIIKVFDTKVVAHKKYFFLIIIQHHKQKKELKSEAEAIGCMLKRGNRVWAGTDRDIIIWNFTVNIQIEKLS